MILREFLSTRCSCLVGTRARLQIAHGEAHGVEHGLDGLTGEIEAPEIEAQRAQKRLVDVVAPARKTMEAPEIVPARLVGGDVDEATEGDARRPQGQSRSRRRGWWRWSHSRWLPHPRTPPKPLPPPAT